MNFELKTITDSSHSSVGDKSGFIWVRTQRAKQQNFSWNVLYSLGLWGFDSSCVLRPEQRVKSAFLCCHGSERLGLQSKPSLQRPPACSFVRSSSRRDSGSSETLFQNRNRREAEPERPLWGWTQLRREHSLNQRRSSSWQEHRQQVFNRKRRFSAVLEAHWNKLDPLVKL